jgi:hypothetical protein
MFSVEFQTKLVYVALICGWLAGSTVSFEREREPVEVFAHLKSFCTGAKECKNTLSDQARKAIFQFNSTSTNDRPTLSDLAEKLFKDQKLELTYGDKKRLEMCLRNKKCESMFWKQAMHRISPTYRYPMRLKSQKV